jgi:hypothetical protein
MKDEGRGMNNEEKRGAGWPALFSCVRPSAFFWIHPDPSSIILAKKTCSHNHAIT